MYGLKKYNKMITSRPLTTKYIINLILDINIRAIDLAIAQDSFTDILIPGISKQELEKEAQDIKKYYSNLISMLNSEMGDLELVSVSLSKIGKTWFNTLKSTLYQVEYDLVSLDCRNYDSIMDLWHIFLGIDASRLENVPINIHEIWKEIKSKAITDGLSVR